MYKSATFLRDLKNRSLNEKFDFKAGIKILNGVNDSLSDFSDEVANVAEMLSELEGEVDGELYKNVEREYLVIESSINKVSKALDNIKKLIKS